MDDAGIQICPLCGSELICRETLGFVYCCSPECGACFRDLSLRGLAREEEAEEGTRRRAASPEEGGGAPPAGDAA
jgi:hypothetical protein